MKCKILNTNTQLNGHELTMLNTLQSLEHENTVTIEYGNSTVLTDIMKLSNESCRKILRSLHNKGIIEILIKRKYSVKKGSDNYRYAVHLSQAYDISLEQYNNMKAQQENKCMICQQTHDKLVVDHCHTSLKVRGLLCHSCNTAIGKLKDDPILFDRAVKYIKGEL